MILFSIIGYFGFGQNGISLNGTANYKFTVDGYQERDPKACGGDYGLRELNIFYDDGSIENLWRGRIWSQNFRHEKLFTKDKRITGIQIYSINKWSNIKNRFISVCNGGPRHNKVRLPVNGTCYSQFYQNPLHVTRNLTIKTYPIYSINYNYGEQYTLGSNQSLKISLPNNLNSYDYVWKYSVGGGNSKEFPSPYNQKATLNIPMTEFIEESDYGKMVHVWVESRCTTNSINQSNKFNFITYKESPHITSHTINKTKCFDTQDGSITLNFDRTLEVGETLELGLKNKVDGRVFLTKNITSDLQSNTAHTLHNLPPGNYRLDLKGTYKGNNTYTDGDTHTIEFEIKSALRVEFKEKAHKNVYCYGGSDGSITIEASGGTGSYQYLVTKNNQLFLDWTNFGGSNITSITNLSEGSYKVKVRDTNACIAKELNNSSVEKEIQVTINQPNASVSLIDSETEIVQPKGYGLSNGYISVMVTGGTPLDNGTYDFEWRKDSSTGTIITSGITTSVSANSFAIKLGNIPTGNYYLTIKDKNYSNATSEISNCGIISYKFFVNQPAPLVAKIEVEQYISCNRANDYPYKVDSNNNGIPDEAEDGILKTTVKGGVGSYNYQWKKLNNGTFENIEGAKGNILPNLTPGTYRIFVKDKNENTTHADMTLVYPEKLEIIMSANSISCHNQNGGEVSVTATGGTGSLSYEWNTMDTTPTITGLPSGNYFVLVTDSKNCKIKGNTEITQPDKIIITDLSVENPICNGANNGMIKVEIAGGKPPYNIAWSNGATTKENTNLSAGTYTLTIKDSNDCVMTKEYTLIDPKPLVIDIQNDVTLCLNEKQEFNVTIEDDQATYVWKNEKGEVISNSAQVTLSEAGLYTVMVRDSKGCTATDSVRIKNSTEVLEPSFLLPTHTYAEATVVLVNTSRIKPQSVEWIIPNDVSVQIVAETEDYLELKFQNTGSYKIGLKGIQGECSKTFYKEVIVEENLSGVDLTPEIASNITEFTIAPNPNTGNFKVLVGLSRENAISLRIINMLSHEPTPKVTKPKSTYFVVPYTINLPSGVYLVILETGSESMVKRMIIQ